MPTSGFLRPILAIAMLLCTTVAGAVSTPAGTPVSAPQPFPPPDARRAPGTADPPEVLALLRQRREAVKAELDLARRSIGEPNFRADVWSALAERLLVAETDLAGTPPERVAAYRTFRDNLKLMEDQLLRVPEPARGQGYFEYGQRLWIRGRRLQAEVSLLRAEEEAAGASPSGGGDSSAVRAALAAWREAVRQWAKMWLDSRTLFIPAFAREIATTALTADLASARDLTEQVAAYQAFRDRLSAVERDTKAEVEKRHYNAFDYLRIKEMRCEADVALARLKGGGAKAANVDPPEIRPVLVEWVEAIGFERDVLRKRYEAGKVPLYESLAVDENLLREELAASTDPASQVAAYKKFLGRLKDAEATARAQPTDDAVGRENAARATYNRATAERNLLQLVAKPGEKAQPELKELLVQIRNALRVEIDLRTAEWAAGQGDFQVLQESAGNLLLTELELADSPTSKLTAYQAHAERMRTAESQCKALFSEKKAPEVWTLWARGARLEAEVWLLRARRNLAAGPAVAPAGATP